MDAIATGRLALALSALDPADRALLELCYRRGVPPTEVADLLGDSLASVVDRRDRALAALGDELGEDHEEAQLERALGDAGAETWTGVIAEGPDERGVEPDDGDAAPPARRGLGSLKRRLLLFGIAALLLGIAAGILIATAGEDSSDEDEPTSRAGVAAEREPTPARRPGRRPGPAVELESQIQGIEGGVSGRFVRTRGRVRLELKARGLAEPRGHYEVWLLDAPRRARSLARFRTSDFDLDAPLPRDFGEYQQVDVTLEPEDGNPDHSGLAVFRTEVSSLAFD